MQGPFINVTHKLLGNLYEYIKNISILAFCQVYVYI